MLTLLIQTLAPHFLGYNRLGSEITAHHTDHREQLDLATELTAPSPKEPRYRNLRGPNQWPDEALIPGFRETYNAYITAMTALSTDFLSLVAQAIGLPKETFEKYFEGVGESESGTKRQDKIKIVKYPDLAELGTEGGQGGEYCGSGDVKVSGANVLLGVVGPHKGLGSRAVTLEELWLTGCM